MYTTLKVPVTITQYEPPLNSDNVEETAVDHFSTNSVPYYTKMTQKLFNKI